MSPPGKRVSNTLLGKSGGELPIVPEGVKWLGQRRHDTQLWMSGDYSLNLKSRTVISEIR